MNTQRRQHETEDRISVDKNTKKKRKNSILKNENFLQKGGRLFD